MRTRGGRLSISLVAFVLGVLLVVQFRAQSAAGGLSALSTQDLTTLIANLNDRNGTLRDQVVELQGQLDVLHTQQANGQSNVGELQDELQRLRAWAGLDPVVGPGVVITVAGPITADAVNEVLNELRLAGAEALAVEDVRAVPGTVVSGDPGKLQVEGTRLGTPFRIAALGDPANLQAILQRPGGIISRIVVSQPDVSLDVRPTDVPFELPSTHRNLVPADATPQV